MRLIKIRKNIVVEPKFFNTNISTIIFEKLIKELKGKCFKKHGIISEIYPDIKILDNTIIGENINFTIEFKASCINPVENDIYNATVINIRPECLMFSIHEKHIVGFVPISEDSKYEYDKDNKKLNLKKT